MNHNENYHTTNRWSVWYVWYVWSIPTAVHDLDLSWQIRHIPDLYDPYDLYDPARIAGWESYDLRDLVHSFRGWIYTIQILHNISERRVRIIFIYNLDLDLLNVCNTVKMRIGSKTLEVREPLSMRDVWAQKCAGNPQGSTALRSYRYLVYQLSHCVSYRWRGTRQVLVL